MSDQTSNKPHAITHMLHNFDERVFRHPKLVLGLILAVTLFFACLLYTSPSPRDQRGSRMPSSA